MTSPPIQPMKNLTTNPTHQPPPPPSSISDDSDSDFDSQNHITLSASQLTSPPHSDYLTLSPPPHSDHITLSPPPHSDYLTLSPPPHSDHITLSPPPHSDHITLSPPHSPSSSSDHTSSHRPSLENEKPHSPEKPAPPPQPTVYRNVAKQPVAILNSVSLDQPVPVVEKTDSGNGHGGGKGVRRKVSPSLSILKKGKREKVVKRLGLGFRVLGFVFCLASFAVMAADRNQGWAVDSFQRYIEFRYCMSVNVIGFVYSGAQAIDLSYNLATGKYFLQHQQARRYFDFASDQIVAYLLISASSSAATRIDDWESNWGKDKFPDMATGSVAMSFLAFVAIALSSLISGYTLCTSKSL